MDSVLAVADPGGLVQARRNGSTTVAAVVGQRSPTATVEVHQVAVFLGLSAGSQELSAGRTPSSMLRLGIVRVR